MIEILIYACIGVLTFIAGWWFGYYAPLTLKCLHRWLSRRSPDFFVFFAISMIGFLIAGFILGEYAAVFKCQHTSKIEKQIQSQPTTQNHSTTVK